MAKKTKNAGWFWNFMEGLQGDKVVWMILLILVMLSILAISSSTPLLALQNDTTRAEIIKEQLFVVGLGLLAVVAIYNFKNIEKMMSLSKWGFLICLAMLIFIAVPLKIGPIKAVEINNATRAISIFGLQLHVYEFTKVLMVMYLAWAVDAVRRDDLPLANRLAATSWGGFFARKSWKYLLYIFGPILTVSVLILKGSVSSTIFIGGIMFITVLVGGIKLKYLMPYAAIAVVLMALCVGLYFASDGAMFGRVGTAMERISRHSEDPMESLLKHKRGTAEFQDVLDMIKQPVSAKVAISEAGFFGKGVGRSTQRYVVPIMFEDYMFSFIVEEYGILGALLVIVLYASLLARGSLIVKKCNRAFERTAIAGLVILISGQAFMHMLINVDLGPLTGQTLPMISHGKSSFLAFSMAFGIILSISRVAKKRMDKLSDDADAIVRRNDEVRDGLSDLNDFESN